MTSILIVSLRLLNKVLNLFYSFRDSLNSKKRPDITILI